MAQASPQPAKQGVNWLGVLADALSGFAGGPANFANRQLEQRQLQDARAYAEQQYQRKREDGFTDWQRQEQWKRDNPAPINNDTVNDYNFISGKLGEDAGKSFLQNLADGPPIAVDVANPDGSVTRQFMPRSQMGGGGMAVPQRPVGKLTPYGGPPSISSAPRPSNTIARSAYEAFVTQYGQQEADAILKRNGLTVGNY
jgi:hypothetical protein